MPKVNITDKKGFEETYGKGFFRNNVEISATATELNQYFITGKIVAISSTSNHVYIPIPVDGTLVAVYSSVSADPGAENLLRVHDGSGSSLGDITIENGSTAGSVDSLTSLSEAVSSGGYIRVISNGGASSTVDAYVTLVIER